MLQNTGIYGEQKTDKEMSHKGIWWSGSVPGINSGTSQEHPGQLGRFMWKLTFKGQNVRGTDGTDDGTDGTCPQDRWDTPGGVPPKFFMFIGLFLSRRKNSNSINAAEKRSMRNVQTINVGKKGQIGKGGFVRGGFG